MSASRSKRSSTWIRRLGRQWTLISEDIGTVGEAQAARKLVEEDKVDILVSPAHGYRNYRSWMLDLGERA